MADRIPLVEARRQLRLEEDDTSRDRELLGFIADALAWIERYTGHILVARDVSETFTGTDRLRLKAWPIKPGATVVATYEDAAGASIAIPGARLNVADRPVGVLPAFGDRWPAIGSARVTVTVRAGYEAEEKIPGNLHRAALVLIQAYENGGDSIDKAERTARVLCSSFRARTL